MTIIPVPLPAPMRCELMVRTLTGQADTRAAFVAGFTEVDPLGEQPAQDGDGVPLLVTDRGLRTPEQFCHDEAVELLEMRLVWLMAPPPGHPGGGLLIPQPRLN